ncbi:type II toxin-antitoxin system Phd/YefM family antitoxin [Azospirillum soli]|uniref:type II toxin-antitoxin system Phd/YefM family antitoxin n=1 Tax=Azospirillum soli TaxID=1304799 RepID=UPI001AE801AE|nr:type II toxin-antitoxin system Phd/YefM family antitoxin [Azospirillum soli]MBP2313731.1 prevent-host-death family protein [Azospirillum soli]
MAKTVNIHEAKTHLSRLLEQVSRGEEVIIAKSGKPIARLVAIDDGPADRAPGVAKGQFAVTAAFFDPLFDDELGWQ